MMKTDQNFDAIILGAGAAGLMCALTAGQRGRRVLLLDHAEKAGKKILISGGGRCNFTNLDTRPDRFLSKNPHFCKSALTRYSPQDFIALVERHGIAWHEKKLGQLFCDGSARAIVAMLIAECAAGHVDLRTGHRITEITKPDHYRVATDHGVFTAPALVLATGGPSIPKMGASGFAYAVAHQFGLSVIPPRPALVPLTALPDDLAVMAPLSGVSIDSIACAAGAAFRENILFTHRGLSGPAILQVSSYWTPGESIALDLLPDLDLAAFLIERKAARPKAELKTVLGEILPQRFAQSFSDRHAPGTIMAGMQDRTLRQIADRLKRWTVTPAGSEGYAKAEVTAGGIDSNALSSKTMEARAVPGLYAIGEAVDVTGWLGGYNFQWAWASGRAAGEAL